MNTKTTLKHLTLRVGKKQDFTGNGIVDTKNHATYHQLLYKYVISISMI